MGKIRIYKAQIIKIKSLKIVDGGKGGYKRREDIAERKCEIKTLYCKYYPQQGVKLRKKTFSDKSYIFFYGIKLENPI